MKSWGDDMLLKGTGKAARPPDLGEKFDRKKCEQRFESLYREQNKWVPKWKEIRDFINPWRGVFDSDASNKHDRRDERLFDGVGFDASIVLAAGIQFGLTPRSRKWYRLGMSDPELTEFDAVRRYLDQVETILDAGFAKSNIYNTFHSVYGSVGPFGTGAMWMGEDYHRLFRTKEFAIGSYAIGTDGFGQVNQFARKLEMTAYQMADFFGADALDEETKRHIRNNDGNKNLIKIHHLIEPNTHRDPFAKDNQNMPFIEYYWLPNGKGFISVTGYHEFPIMAPRWDVLDDSVYGYGPGWYALCESKTLQMTTENLLTALEMVIKPPTNATAETAKYGVNLFPGAVNIVGDNGANVSPVLQVRPDIQSHQVYNESIRQVIKRRFYADLFLMLDSLDKGQMTAREVIERSQEKMSQLGPSVERFQVELLNPVIDRGYAIASRMGVLPDPPRELVEYAKARGMEVAEIKVEYVSPLSQAQKVAGLSGVEQYIAFAQNMAAGGFPGVLKKVNELKVIDRYGDMLGIPNELLRTDKEVEDMQAEEVRRMQQQQAMQDAMAATQAAKNLATSPIEGNNALTALIGGPPGVTP